MATGVKSFGLGDICVQSEQEGEVENAVKSRCIDNVLYNISQFVVRINAIVTINMLTSKSAALLEGVQAKILHEVSRL